MYSLLYKELNEGEHKLSWYISIQTNEEIFFFFFYINVFLICFEIFVSIPDFIVFWNNEMLSEMKIQLKN
jgi:hypothetical protein